MDVQLVFENPGCLIWDHLGGTEPANTSNPVEILKITAPEYNNGYISLNRSETYVDIVFGPVFGARYYFSDNFAVSGEFQISFVDTDSKGSAEIDRIGNAFYTTTSQLLAVYLYF